MFLFCKRFFYFSVFIIFIGCNSDSSSTINGESTFYYWKTVFELTAYEKDFLTRNNITKLYVRFFDVGLHNGQLEPLGKVFFKEKPSQNIVPVVFIKNDIFYDKNLNILDFSTKVYNLISQIASYNNLDFDEIQIDCDWSKTTKTAYFSFLKELKNIDKKKLSVTIRLHQIKYPNVTGIPNADYGVLMYYNMGKINADDKNSIYDREIALKYIPYIKNYKLPLVTALPIFNWLIHSKNNQVQNIIPKVLPKDIANLKEIKPTIFEVQTDMYYQNYVLKKGDILKFEFVSGKEIKTIVTDINRYSKSATKQIIWYDLDEHNLNLYKNEKLFN